MSHRTNTGIYMNLSIKTDDSTHHLQEQYTFIHDAILESITCGNTQISASNLQIRVNKLKQRDGTTNLTGFEQQFKACLYTLPSQIYIILCQMQVLEQVSPRIENQQSAQAIKHNDKNRPKHCLPGE